MKTKKQKETLLEAGLPFEAIIDRKGYSTVPKRKGYKYACVKGHVRF